MADKVISKIKLPTGTNGAQETHVIKDREAADTRITEAEIIALVRTNYKPDLDGDGKHEDDDHITGGNS